MMLLHVNNLVFCFSTFFESGMSIYLTVNSVGTGEGMWFHLICVDG